MCTGNPKRFIRLYGNEDFVKSIEKIFVKSQSERDFKYQSYVKYFQYAFKEVADRKYTLDIARDEITESGLGKKFSLPTEVVNLIADFAHQDLLEDPIILPSDEKDNCLHNSVNSLRTLIT